MRRGRWFEDGSRQGGGAARYVLRRSTRPSRSHAGSCLRPTSLRPVLAKTHDALRPRGLPCSGETTGYRYSCIESGPDCSIGDIALPRCPGCGDVVTLDSGKYILRWYDTISPAQRQC